MLSMKKIILILLLVSMLGCSHVKNMSFKKYCTNFDPWSTNTILVGAAIEVAGIVVFEGFPALYNYANQDNPEPPSIDAVYWDDVFYERD